MAAPNLMGKILRLALLAALVAACDLFGPDTLQERRAQLDQARALWNARDVHDYLFTLGRTCGECPFMDGRQPFSVRILVEADTIRSATFVATGEPLPSEDASLVCTIDELFDIVAADIESKPYRFSIDYDSLYGFPRYYFIDPARDVVDDEHGLSASDLVPS